MKAGRTLRVPGSTATPTFARPPGHPLSGRRTQIEGVRNGDPGARVIQIPLEWPAREGTVVEVDSDVPPAAVLIEWDDGRRDWIEDADVRALRIWVISDEPMRELTAGPLEIQLSKFMGGGVT